MEGEAQNGSRFWDRQELYDLVWSEPMQVLAKKYGVSDVAFAKVCRKLLIPAPGRGYWAKKAVGTAPKPDKLCDFPSAPKILRYQLAPEKVVTDADGVGKVASPPRDPAFHELIMKEIANIPALMQELERIGKGIPRHQLCKELEKLGPPKAERFVTSRGGGRPFAKVLDIRVSEGTFERTLKFLDQLFWVAGQLGIQVRVTYLDSQREAVSEFVVHESAQSFWVHEPFQKHDRGLDAQFKGKQPKWQWDNPRHVYLPTGKLKLGFGYHLKYQDGAKKALEHQIPEIVSHLLKERLAERDREIEREVARKEAERREAIRREALKRQQLETERREDFAGQVAQFNQWNEASTYLTYMQANFNEDGNPVGDPDRAEWFAWAHAYTESLKPKAPSLRTQTKEDERLAKDPWNHWGLTRT